MMGPSEVVPRARNFYLPEDYFTLNVQNGVLRSLSGARMLTLNADFLRGLHQAVVDETGKAWPIVLRSCGRIWGKRWVKHYLGEVQRLYQVDPAELSLAFFMQILRHFWSLHGWGKIDLSLEVEPQGFLIVTVDNAPYSDVIGALGARSEYLLAGMLAALGTELSGRELDCIQTSCRSAGDQRCRFLLGIDSRLKVVAAWLEQGRRHEAIVDAIKLGESA